MRTNRPFSRDRLGVLGPDDPHTRSARIFIFAVWLCYVGLILRGVTPVGTLMHHSGRFLFDLAGALLICAGLQRLFIARNSNAYVHKFGPAYFYLGLCALAAVVGIANHNDWVRWTLLGVAPFVSGATMGLAANPVLVKRLYRTLLAQTYISTVYGLYVLMFARPSGRVEWYGGSGDGKANVAWRAMYALPFLLPVIDTLKPSHRNMLAGAYLMTLLLHIIGANRGPLVSYAFFLPAILFILAYRRRNAILDLSRFFRRAMLTAGLGACITGLIFLHFVEFTDYAVSGYQETMGRLTGHLQDPFERHDNFTSNVLDVSYEEFIGPSSRGGELRDFIDQMEAQDWVIGRGFGGQWYSKFWGVDWNMVHIGPAHLLLVGGVPLFAMFLYLWFTALRYSWHAARTSPAAQSAFCYLAMFLLGFAQHGAIADDPEVFLMWMTVGIALAHGAPPKKVLAPRRITRAQGLAALARQPVTNGAWRRIGPR